MTALGSRARDDRLVGDLVPMDRAARIAGVVSALDGAGVDALVITSSTNITYLTGFDGSAGTVLVHRDGVLLATDDRYGERAEALTSELTGLAVAVGPGAAQKDAIVAAAGGAGGAGRVGLEADDVSWDAANRYGNEWFPGSDLVATTGVVADIRLVKDAGEVQRVERAAAITDHALAEVAAVLADRPTERDFQLLLDRAILDGGADDLSFATIVASGPLAARPHHTPSNRVIEPGDLVIVDVGALVEGYHSDMTRTFFVGEPDDASAEMIAAATEAQAAGVAAVRPGVTGDEIDRAARAVIEGRGLGPEFVHGVGHGVGLLIHEDPFLKGSAVPLQAGQVVTVEPGVYRSGFGGVRVEDTVVVTPDGCRPLTRSPKNPVVAAPTGRLDNGSDLDL